MSIDGLIAGRVGVTLHDLEDLVDKRDVYSTLFGFVFFTVALMMLVGFYSTGKVIGFINARSRPVRYLLYLFSGSILIGLVMSAGLIGGPAVGSYMFSVPKWEPATTFPPYIVSELEWDWWIGVRRRKEYGGQ